MKNPPTYVSIREEPVGSGRNKFAIKVGGGLLKQPGGVGPLGEEVHVPVDPLVIVLPVEKLHQ